MALQHGHADHSGSGKTIQVSSREQAKHLVDKYDTFLFDVSQPESLVLVKSIELIKNGSDEGSAMELFGRDPLVILCQSQRPSYSHTL